MNSATAPVRIDSALHRLVKMIASARGLTIKDYIAQALMGQLEEDLPEVAEDLLPYLDDLNKQVRLRGV